MNALPKSIPTDSELEVLQILWQHGPQTVRFVNDALNKKREVGYTTTLKIMQIMLDKNLVSREITNRSHVFTATAEESSTQTNIMQQFITNTFRGSASSLVMRLLDSDTTSTEELEKIKAFINQHTNS